MLKSPSDEHLMTPFNSHCMYISACTESTDQFRQFILKKENQKEVKILNTNCLCLSDLTSLFIYISFLLSHFCTVKKQSQKTTTTKTITNAHGNFLCRSL